MVVRDVLHPRLHHLKLVFAHVGGFERFWNHSQEVYIAKASATLNAAAIIVDVQVVAKVDSLRLISYLGPYALHGKTKNHPQITCLCAVL